MDMPLYWLLARDVPFAYQGGNMTANISERGNNQGSNQGGGSGSQQGGGSQSSGQYGKGHKYMDARQDPDNPNYDPNWQPGPVGAVEDAENDGRLSENREAGRTKGTTEHSSKAPHVDKSTAGSINKQGDDFGGGDGGGSLNQ
jgi:hypothetical protein